MKNDQSKTMFFDVDCGIMKETIHQTVLRARRRRKVWQEKNSKREKLM